MLVSAILMIVLARSGRIRTADAQDAASTAPESTR
jgi:hypothetical protein